MKTTDIVAKQILQKLDGGLGNRIRPMLSGLFMSHKLNIPIAFRWAISPGCSCPVDLLFEPRVKWADFEGPCLDYRTDRQESDAAFERALCTEQILKLKSPVFFEAFHRLYPKEAKIWIAANLDRYFVPKADLMKIITSFAEKYAVGEALGVHVRQGDKVGRVGDLPTLEVYFNLIEQILPDNSRIFLATDDGRSTAESYVLQKFSRRYGKKLIYRRKASVDRGVKGSQDALVDLWLLRRCSGFIGFKGSTYSETAALGRQAILI